MNTINTKRILSNLATHDPAQLHVTAGFRNALGIVLPLLVGTLTGHVSTAVVMAVGALVSGLAGLSGTIRQRLRTMTFAVLWIGLASFLGSVVGHSLMGIMIVTMVSGFLAGMMVALSPQATQVGTLATIGLVIFSGFPATPYFAGIQTLLVIAGGMLQLILMIVLAMIVPQATETDSVVAVIKALTDYIQHPTRQYDLNLSYALAMAEGQVRDSLISPRYRQYLWDVLRQVQQIRLLFVDQILETKVRDGTAVVPIVPRNMKSIISSLEIAAQELRRKSKNVRLNRPFMRHPLMGQRLDSRSPVSWSLVPLGPFSPKNHVTQAVEDLVTLAKAPPNNILEDGNTVLDVPVEPIIEPIAMMVTTLKANLTGHSAAFRHALRMAVILGFAVWLYGTLALSRGYWVPLTTLVILKPDFFSTVVRGVARVLGTIGGVVLATGLIALPLHPLILTLIFLVVFAVGLYTVFSYNYTLFSAFMTAEIVVLLSFFDHLSPVKTVQERVIDTLIGTALALASYLLWPRWQKTSVAAAIADLVQSQRLYFQFLIMHCESTILTLDQTAFYRLQIQLARTNALSSLNHVLSRRDKRPVDVEAASGLLTALHRFGEALQIFHTYCVQKSLRVQDKTKQAGELTALTRSFVEILEGIEQTLRTDPRHIPATLIKRYLDLQPGRDPKTLETHEAFVAQALYSPIGTMMRMFPL
ncbi:FUSC family protein [Sulfobacillus thermosulfidooxidans]|uniref:FUSC family protein n=1 Tax=Sulfobacillus thermosulfidooxidans TaxID=28034 RepID=UPI0006B6905F|nr:FUSC family protein [Sulfobacillus thermosulfidooxidans]